MRKPVMSHTATCWGAAPEGAGRAPTLIVLAKPAIPGRVKTRLIPGLGAVGAARLHSALVRRTLAVAQGSQWERVELHAAMPRRHGLFRACEHEFAVPCAVQSQGDLGRRMDASLRRALRNAPYAALIGSDCPALSERELDLARRALAQGVDAVLGPARDGGYWLIGVRTHAGFLFRAMPWGTPAVLETTRRRLRRRGWKWIELPSMGDLDRPADLRALGAAGGETAAWIRRAVRDHSRRARLTS
jgi:rSAM/selenodomain-associated transferase 1